MTRKNSSTSVTRTSVRALAGVIALTALGYSLAAPAAALGTVSLNAAPSVDSASNAYYVDNTVVTASASGLTANSTYYVGVCETATYPLGVPACGSFTSTTSSATGAISATVTVNVSASNSHAAVPGQPADIDCSAPGSCQVAVANHTGRVFVDTSVPFYVQ